VFRPSRDDDGEACADHCTNTIENRLTRLTCPRRVQVDTLQKTVRINLLLQGLVVCARCGGRLKIQTPKRGPTYYREDSHLRGYRDCSDISQCVRAESIDTQVGELV